MKNLIYLLLILAAGYWMYSKCSDDDNKNEGVLKQVKVSVKTANLRTGPGTSYDFATASGDEGGDKLQVTRGTVLQVVAVKNGWYEVRIPGDSTTAYIKQTLCTDMNGAKGKKGGKGRKAQSHQKASGDKATEKSTPAKSATPMHSTSDDEVVEEMKGSSADDEVLF